MKNLFSVVLTIAFTTFGFSQDSLSKNEGMEMHDKIHEKMYYTCPMHREVMKDHPGKCPKCGMDLVQENKMTSHYCPVCKKDMDFKDGKCAQCGKEITKYGEKGQIKKVYICSSCGHKNKKRGACSKCGTKAY